MSIWVALVVCPLILSFLQCGDQVITAPRTTEVELNQHELSPVSLFVNGTSISIAHSTDGIRMSQHQFSEDTICRSEDCGQWFRVHGRLGECLCVGQAV